MLLIGCLLFGAVAQPDVYGAETAEEAVSPQLRELLEGVQDITAGEGDVIIEHSETDDPAAGQAGGEAEAEDAPAGGDAGGQPESGEPEAEGSEAGEEDGEPTETALLANVNGALYKASPAAGGVSTGDSQTASVSGDGTKFAFVSKASNLVEGDTNGFADIFLHDRGTGTTKRINLGNGGQQADNHSYLPVISLDGRFVLFTSKAQNMPGNTGWQEDLYLYDDQSGTIEKIFDNVQASTYGAAGSPFQMSADGRYIAFAGPKPNSFSGWEVMVKDRLTGKVQQASNQVFVFGQPPLPRVSISADGRYVAFDSYYKSLVSGDTNERSDIFLYDTKRESLKRISVSAEGIQGNGDSRFPFISADGRYVAYQSYASNLAPGDTDGQQDVFVYDRLIGLTDVASFGSDGIKGRLSSNDATISADGRFVAFHTDNAFDPADTGVSDVYVRDRALGRTFWASRAATGGSGDQWSVRAFISADGRTVAFESHATNLLDPADADGFYDIYAAALPDPGTSAPAWTEGAVLTAPRIGASYIALSWPAAEGAAHYRIYRNGALEAITSRASHVSAGLAPETSYSFRVQAGSADYVWSASALELTDNTSAQPETEAPGQASNVQGTPIPGGMRVSWQDPDDLDVTGVKLQWRKAGGEPRETPMLARGDGWAEVPGLMNRTAYEFRVLAYDGDGNRSASEWAGATTGAGPRVERVNVRPLSGKMSASDIDESSISDDGRYIVFATDAADIAARDDNREQDVFLYDRELGRTTLISRALDNSGTTANGASSGVEISGNGRFIVFGSGATNLTAAPDTNKNWDVFLHDRDPDQNGVFDEDVAALEKITVLPDGTEANGGNWQPSITSNGDSILFTSRARNLTPDAPDDYHYVRYERADRSFARLALADGTTPDLSNGTISGDGSHAVFATISDIVPGDENGKQDIYAYSFATKELTWISKFDEGFQRGWASTYDMSEDARYIVFGIGELENRMGGVFLVDREAAPGTPPQSVVVPYDGRAPMGYSEGASISDDGRYVAFTSSDQTLVKGDTNAQADVFVRDLVKGANIRAALPYDPAQQGNDSAVRGDLSGDGRWMTFQTSANNFVTGELRKQLDLFVTSVEAAEPAAAAWPSGSALTVTETGHDSLTVGWTAAERATAYQVRYGSVVKDVPAGTTTAKLTGLQPDTAYELKVEASADGGTWTTNGPAASARTKAAPALAELKLSLSASGGVRLEWEPPAAGRDIATLAVMRREGDTEPVQLTALEDLSVRAYTDDTTQAGKTYRYSLVAKDSQGASAPYTHERVITVRTLAVTGVHYAMPLYANTYAGLGDRIDFIFLSEPGADAAGSIVYETTGGATRELSVPIKAEGVTGRYKGSVNIPGEAVRLLSSEVWAEKDGQRAAAAAWSEPIAVGGSLQINITGNRALAQQAILTVRSEQAEAVRTTRPGASGALLLKGMAPAKDYQLTLLHPESGDLLLDAPPSQVAVAAGERTTFAIEPQDTVRVSITASTPSNQPAGGAKVTIAEPGSGRSYTAVTNASGQAQFGVLAEMDGKTVRIRVEAGSDRLLPSETTSKLARGVNGAAVELPWNAEAVVRGTVNGQSGEKIAGATVTIRQGDAIFTAQADGEGRYEARVLRGAATIQASIPPYTHGPWIARTLESGVTEIPLRIEEPLPSKIEVKLFTRAAGGAWIGPHELDWRTFAHYHIDSPHLLLTRSNPLVVKANPGEKVEICANGVEAGMPIVCGETVISAERTGHIELRLEEAGALAVADLKETLDPEALNTWKLFARGREGARRLIADGTWHERRMQWQLPQAGEYELEVFGPDEKGYVKRTFNAAADQTVNLGQIAFAGDEWFGGRDGNEVTLDRDVLTPGTDMLVRASVRNQGGQTAKDVKLVLDIPAGTSLVEGSVLHGGHPRTPIRDGGRIALTLGDLPARLGSVVQYRLQADENEPAEALAIVPKIVYTIGGEQREEAIGTVTAELLHLTLDAPGTIGRKDVRLGGRAPADSRVVVLEGARVLGETMATPGGFWSLKAELAGEGATAIHRIRAEAVKGERHYASDSAMIRYDEGHPEMMSFTMKQADGREVQLDPADGTGRFPYVYVPGLPFSFALNFNKPELVRDVVFRFGDASMPAGQDDKGVFRAVISGAHAGRVSVSYRTIQAAGAQTPPPAEELEGQLPPAFQDLKDKELDVSERTPGATRQTAKLKGTIPTSGGDVDMSLGVTMERKQYVPTAADLARERETGVALYGLQMSHGFRDGKLTIELSAYMPDTGEGLTTQRAMALLTEGGLGIRSGTSGSPRTASLSGAALNAAVNVVATRLSAAFASRAGDMTWKTIDAGYSLVDGLGVNDTLSEMSAILDQVTDGCSTSAVNRYVNELDSLYTRLIVYESTKAAMMIVGVLAGPETFGLGTIAMFMLTNAAGKVLDGEMAGRLQGLRNAIANDAECRDEEDDDDDDRPDDDLADPEWIHDPSGYVYEVTEDNRIPDVQATALRWNEEAGAWQVWNAEWYGQLNPMYTNGAGRYGWDVPEGKWKVRYEKEGYLPAESRELIVLPPHFDVNVAMVSTQPASVTRAVAAAGGGSVDVAFNRHVMTDDVNGQLFTISDAASGETVPGEWAAVDVIAYDGKQVALTVRFTPDAPLTVGGTYALAVDAAVQSYAGVPMTAAYEAEFLVTEADETPPLGVTEVNATADASQIMLGWQETADPDLLRVDVQYRVKGSTGEPRTASAEPGAEWMLLNGLASGTVYAIDVLAVDAAGNASKTAIEARTAGEQLAGADVLAPKPAAEVRLTPGSGSIAVTWTDPADADLDGVIVSWRKSGDGEAADTAQVAKGAQRHVIDGLAASTAYEVTLYVVDKSGNESSGETLTARTSAGTSGGPGGNPGPGPVTGGQTGEPDDKPDAEGSESTELTVEGGQHRLLDGKLTLQLAANSVRASTELTAEQLAAPTTPAGWTVASPAYRLHVGGGSLLKRAALSVTYDASLLKGADPRKLGVYRQDDAAASGWSHMGGIVDTKHQLVTAPMTDSGTYAVMAYEPSFQDLAGHWGREAIELLASRHLAAGAPDGRFYPNRGITRAEFAKLLVLLARALPETEVGTNAGDSLPKPRPFADVPGGAWYAVYVNEAAALGFVRGADGKFRPNDAVTREEMVAMLARVMGAASAGSSNAASVLTEFRDADSVSGWAKEAVAAAVREGWLTGAAGQLAPQRTASRAEAAALVARVMERSGAVIADSPM